MMRIHSSDENGWVDPILAIGVVDRALRQSFVENSPATSPTPIPFGDNGKIDLGLVASNPQVNLRRQAGARFAQWSDPQPA